MSGIQIDAEFTGKDSGLAATVSKVEGELGKIDAANKRTADGAGVHADKMSIAHDQIGGATEKSAGRARNASGQFVSAHAEMGAAAGTSATNTEGAGERIGGAHKKMGDSADKSTEKFKTWAVAAAAAALAAEAAIARSAITSSANMETAYAHMKGLVGVNDSDLGALRDQAVQVGHDTGVGAQAAADAQYYLTSAGLTTAQSMEATTIAAKAQASGLGTMSQVADASSSVMNAYAKSGMTAAKATDIMVASVKFGKMEAASLGQEIGQVIPIASNMGISFDQVGAAVAGMSLTGMTAGEAVTGLRAAIQAMMTPTQAGENHLREYGLSGEKLRATIKDKGLLAGMQQLRTAFKGHDEDLKPAVHSVEAFNGILALTGDNAAQISTIFDGVKNSTGALDTAFGAVKDTMQFKMNQATADLKQGMIDLGREITPMAATAVGAFGDMAKWIGDIPGPLLAATGAMTGMAAAIGAASKVAGPLSSVFSELVGGTGMLAPAMAGATIAVGLGAVAWSMYQDNMKHQAWQLDEVSKAMERQGEPSTVLGHHIDDLTEKLKHFNNEGQKTPEVIDGIDPAALTKDLGEKGVESLGKLGISLAEIPPLLSSGSDQFQKFRDVGLEYGQANLKVGDSVDDLILKILKGRDANRINGDEQHRLMGIMDQWSDRSDEWRKKQDALNESKARQNLIDAQKKPEVVPQLEQAGVRLNIDTTDIGKLPREQVIALSDDLNRHLIPSTNDVAAAMDRFNNATGNAEGSAGAMKATEDELAAKATALKTAIENVDNAMDRWLGVTLSRDESQAKWIESTDKMTESFTKNGASMDIHTAAGRANTAAANDNLRTTRDMLKANNDLGGSEETAIAIRNNARDSWVAQATAAGVSAEKIEEYKRIYNGLPATVGPAVVAQDEAAKATKGVGTEADTTKGKVNGLDGTKANITVTGDATQAQQVLGDTDVMLGSLNGKGATIHVTAALEAVGVGQGLITAVGNLPASAFGIHQAKGGAYVAGAPYLVGEEGPELRIPGESGTTIPADLTAGILGGGGGGSVININVAPVMGMSATATGQQIGAAIRQEVRRQGGALLNVPARAF